MELIDRYVNAVGKHLPNKTRADIETEIRSTLEDMLADRSEKAGRPADEAMVKDLLRAYGPPEKVAATYLPERYLIGPRMFPLFWLVVRIVFSVLTVLAVIGMGVRIGMQPLPTDALAELVGKLVLEYFQGMITALGNIVLVFAILERVLPESQKASLDPSEPQTWDPEQLMQEPSGDEVKLWEPVLAILFTALGLILFNFYPQVIGVMINPASLTFIPILSDAFFAYLPWLNLLWLLGIGLQLVLLRQGRYTPAARWFDVALKAGGLVLVGAMLSGPSLVALTASQLTGAGMESEAAEILVQMFSTGVRIGLGVALVATTVELIKDIYRLLRKPGARLTLSA